jgi:glycerophosphoryl diester phosphodiesterase
MLGTVTFISMNWTSLDRMRGQATDLTIGYIVDEAGKAAEALQRAAGDPGSLVDLRADLLDDRDLAHRVATTGVDLAVWTVDDTDQADRVLEAGARRITTNQVAELVAWKRGR